VRAFANDGRLLTLTLASSSVTGAAQFVYEYDSARRLARVDDGGNTFYWEDKAPNTPLASGTTGGYDALGRLVAESEDNGLIAKSRAYSANSDLETAFSVGFASGAKLYDVSALTYAGTMLTGYRESTSANTYTFSYDRDGRLFQATATATAGQSPTALSQTYNESYSFFLDQTFDPSTSSSASLWNLQAELQTASDGTLSRLTYGYSAAAMDRVVRVTNALTGGTDYYGYDTRGRGLLTTHKTTATQAPAQHTFGYDALGRLVSISKVSAQLEQLSYDAGGELAARSFCGGAPFTSTCASLPTTSDQARYYMSDEMTIVQRNGAVLVYAHLTLNHRRVASVWRSSASTSGVPSVLYYHRDRLGSVVATSQNGGGAGVSYRYLPYGTLDKVAGIESDSAGSELGYGGALRLSEGILHMGARDYYPQLRRFLQPDTIDLIRYGYVHGDPANHIDPSGREPQLIPIEGKLGDGIPPVPPDDDAGDAYETSEEAAFNASLEPGDTGEQPLDGGDGTLVGTAPKPPTDRPTVSINGDNLDITLPINFTCDPGSCDKVETITKQIEDAWSTHGDETLAGYHVKLTVIVVADERVAYALINLREGYAPRLGLKDHSQVLGPGRTGTKRTDWFIESPAAPHESAHLLGMKDGYIPLPGGYATPRRGFESSITWISGGPATAQDIRTLVAIWVTMEGIAP